MAELVQASPAAAMSQEKTVEDIQEKTIPPPTDRIYLSLEGNFLLTSTSVVLDLTTKANEKDAAVTDVTIVLDKSPFHPQGGGQPTDIGTITFGDIAVSITKVGYDFATRVVTHVGSVATEHAGKLNIGDKVDCQVDEENRYLCSSVHSAGHVIDSAMARVGMTFPPTKGYHFMDGPYVEYKGKIPDAKEKENLVAKLQVEFAQIVEEDIQSNICMMTRPEAEEACNRIQKNFDFDNFTDPAGIRIVTIANFQCPCGGTHVRSTRELKDWTVLKIKGKKDKLQVRYGPKPKV